MYNDIEMVNHYPDPVWSKYYTKITCKECGQSILGDGSASNPWRHEGTEKPDHKLTKADIKSTNNMIRDEIADIILGTYDEGNDQPETSAQKAAKQIIKYLKSIGYEAK